MPLTTSEKVSLTKLELFNQLKLRECTVWASRWTWLMTARMARLGMKFTEEDS